METMGVNGVKNRIAAIVLLSVCSAVTLMWGLALASVARGTILDFKNVYLGERVFCQHHDPYDQSELLRVYFAEGGERAPGASPGYRTQMIVACQMYLPSALLLIAPFGLLPWPVAYLTWIALTTCGITTAAILMWQVASRYATSPPLYMILFLLLNSGILFAGGNAAGVAVALCIIAAWCFLEDRYVTVGMACMAVSLAIKPHDAGLIWLYLLLAGAATRKRALKTLFLITVTIGLIALVWVQRISPHWLPELQQNLREYSVPGSFNDPGPVANRTVGAGMIIDLETVTSVVRDDPGFYKISAYLLCTPLVLFWGFLTLRSRFAKERAWLALAAIAPLAMLPVYHRPYDAKLLLLVIPACAMHWSATRAIRAWSSLILTGAAIVFTSDFPLAFLSILSNKVHVPGGASGAVMTILLMRPAPLALLALGVFNLFQYARDCRVEAADGGKVIRSLNTVAVSSQQLQSGA